ncbi:type II secretion system F family protein [Natronomonas sp. EA1]|uniref:type II secretion system F family protein n=1 Tax=Natronomonas sp. EA1 TaxID=3421655 RepID=UPI003EC01BA6
MVLVYLPLLLAALLVALVVVAPTAPALDRRLTHVAFRLFGGRIIEQDSSRERSLRSAGLGTPYRVYATKTYLFTAIGAVSGAILGIYLGALVIDVLNVERITSPIAGNIFRPLPDWLLSFSAKYFAVLFIASLVFGAFGATIAYLVRWKVPAVRANTRSRQIDAGMPRTIAFVYALSRGGMAFPDVMRALARNRGVFGTTADEISVGVRNIDLFNDDLISAMQDISRRSPSEQFQKFTENLVSVLQSGGSVARFLRDEYERYQEEAEEQQQEILDLLSATAEIYVTTVVAGMLFLITILLVIGLTAGGMLPAVQLLTYLVLPATNVLFVAYLSDITQPLRASRTNRTNIEQEVVTPREAPDTRVTATDGGHSADRERLQAYRSVHGIIDTISNPLRSLTARPELVLYVTVPVALGFFLIQLPAVFVEGVFDLRRFDDVLVQSVLLVLGTFAIAHELSTRRLDRLEGAVPDLLDRLASVNEAGVAAVTSFDRVRRSDLGALGPEVQRIWRDIQWGATVEEALGRFERRVETPAVTRVVTLITNAMRASNEIGPVLRIAADQARADRRLKRRRQQEMFTYLLIIYVAFFVFLVVIGAIDYVLIPSLPDTSSLNGAGSLAGPGIISLGDVDVEGYRLTFFHAGLIQAAMSGLVGGQMSGGSIRHGAKHAAIMLTVAYVGFLLLGGSGLAENALFLAPF